MRGREGSPEVLENEKEVRLRQRIDVQGRARRRRGRSGGKRGGRGGEEEEGGGQWTLAREKFENAMTLPFGEMETRGWGKETKKREKSGCEARGEG